MQKESEMTNIKALFQESNGIMFSDYPWKESTFQNL